RQASDVGGQVGFAEGSAFDEAQDGDPGLGMDDLGRQARFERGHRRGSFPVAEDVVNRDVLAAARDELLAAMAHHERDVGQATLQRRQRDRFLPAGEPRHLFFQLRHCSFRIAVTRSFHAMPGRATLAPVQGGKPMPDARVSNTITGRDAFLRVLSDEGVTKMFGNPGTTELPIMHALSSAPEMGYVLGLQEAVVICMADGYARASGKLVSCNVHVAPGLGNAIGSIYTSLMSGTPMIVTAGQQERGPGLTEPLLYAPLVPIAQPVVKWATEVSRIEDLPRILRRAAKVATTAPTGPVFLSLPGDILNNEAAIDMAAPPRVEPT